MGYFVNFFYPNFYKEKGLTIGEVFLLFYPEDHNA